MRNFVFIKSVSLFFGSVERPQTCLDTKIARERGRLAIFSIFEENKFDIPKYLSLPI